MRNDLEAGKLGARGAGLVLGSVSVVTLGAAGALVGVVLGDGDSGFLIGAAVAVPLLLLAAVALVVKGLRSEE